MVMDSRSKDLKIEYQRIVEHSQEKQQELTPFHLGEPKPTWSVQHLILGLSSQELFKTVQKREPQGDIAMLHKTCLYGLTVVHAIRR
ncbi:hypothetical protein AQUCO_00900017v1 [Aquilegia coerulea]|uniref:Uncharacterized protein n=1 Tax=Aquilegia coerulea TaxID=218851 RepID=A0A2G5EBJ5_AQUCA|nr:hypothetical protein AQUCO_00900017v1 [Aquilegia coerulea]